MFRLVPQTVQLAAIRRSTYSGRPLGSQEFTRRLEKEIKRRLAPQKRGPKKKTDRSENRSFVGVSWTGVSDRSFVDIHDR